MTLDQIIDDILLTCYYTDKEKSEILHRRQVQAWVHQYRLLLLKQEISKNSVIDPSYVSYHVFKFKPTEAIEVVGGLSVPNDGVYSYDSMTELPELAPLIGRLGITSVVVYSGERQGVGGIPVTTVSIGDISRSMYAKHDIWNTDKFIAHIYNGRYLRLVSYMGRIAPTSDGLQLGVEAKCGLILAQPSDMVQEINKPYVRDEEYPIPIDRIPRLKQMIFSSELQWLIPPQGTAQSSQMAKVEEQELHNNPAALMQVGSDFFEGM